MKDIKNYRVDIIFNHDSNYARDSFEFHWYEHASRFFASMINDPKVSNMRIIVTFTKVVIANWGNANTADMLGQKDGGEAAENWWNNYNWPI